MIELLLILLLRCVFMDALHADVWWSVLRLCPENAATLETWMCASQTTLLCCGQSGLTFKRSPLAAACERGSWGTVQRLCYKVGIPHDMTGLKHAAATGGHLHIIQWLLYVSGKAAMHPLGTKWVAGVQYPIIDQAVRGSVRTLRLPPWFVHANLQRWLCLFHPAAINGHLHICEFIMKLPGMTPRYLADNFEAGMFMTVAERGHLVMCQWLFKHIPPHDRGAQIRGALMGACRGGHLETCQLLCHYFLFPDRDPVEYPTPTLWELRPKQRFVLNRALVVAASRGHLHICQHLVSLGAQPETDRHLAFRMACEHGHLKTGQWLYINWHMTLDDLQVYNSVALRNAAHNQHKDVCLWLLSLGVRATFDHPFLASISQ
jgi:hypothetical protein